MKRFLGLALALCLILGLSGCQVITRRIVETEAENGASAGEPALYAHSLELAGLLEEMLRSPEYFELMGGSQGVSDLIIPLMRSDLSQPESAYLITLSEDALPLLLDGAEADMEGFSPGLREFLERRMFQSVASILNAQQGTEALAAASILTVSDAWAGESLEAGCYVLLHYPDACPVMASFWGGDGLMEGTATMLIGEPLDEDSVQGVAALFQQLGMDGIQVKQLEINED